MTNKNSPPVVEVNNVSFAYQNRQVLTGIDLKVYPGDYVGIIGPNGGGKTTLLKIILGLIKPNSGSVSLFGQDVKPQRTGAKIGYIPQKAVNFEFAFPATVEEVVIMGRYAQRGLFRGVTKSDWKKAEHALNQVGMADYRRRLISELSAGQQQRVFIARALAGEPEILFLDEPTVGVDLKAQEEFYTLLCHLNTNLHITLILVSHDIDVIANEVNTLAWINEKLIYYGEPKRFIKEDLLEKLFDKNVKLIMHNHIHKSD